MPEKNTLPPMTATELRAELRNPDFISYVYIGAENEVGWKNARAAREVLVGVLIFRAEDKSHVQDWLSGAPDIKALAFGWGDTVFRALSKKEAEDFVSVVDAIAEAGKQTGPV